VGNTSIWNEWSISIRAGVDRTVHPNDRMMNPGEEESYFLMGDWAVRCVKAAVECAALSFEVKTDAILDLPSGYGRVTRFLRAAYPDAEITACDILKEGVDFCVDTFGVKGIHSSHDPAEIEAESYDLIWCGSLLTHMPERQWDAWLTFFEDHLNPGGTLVFTAHGEDYAQGLFALHMPRAFEELQAVYRQEGFAFSGNEHPADLHHDPGISLSSPEWVLWKLRKRPDLRVTAFMQRGWHDAHDVWSVTKATESSLQRDAERRARDSA
jgi:SAM-dependent methyltransferase